MLDGGEDAGVIVLVALMEASQETAVVQYEVVRPRRIGQMLPVALGERDRIDRRDELRHEATPLVASEVRYPARC